MEQLKTYFYSLSISKRIGILVLGILILSLPLVIVVSQQVQETRQRASELPATPPDSKYVSLKGPTTSTVTVGINFNIPISIDSRDNQITGDDIKIIFDKNVLELVSFTPTGGFLENVLVNKIDNDNGNYQHVAVNTRNDNLNQPGEVILLGNLVFKAKTVGISQVLFENPQITALNYGGIVPTYNNDTGTYTIINPPTATPTPVIKNGDANGDGSVDIIDYNIWRDEFLGTAVTKRSDFNKDGKIDITDFAIWRNAFNPNPSPTTIVVTPTPTQPPQQSYRRVFITSTTYDGNLGGLTGADAKCQERAGYIAGAENSKIAGGGGPTWKAWLSDSTTSASSRLTHLSGPYKLLNGNVVANNWNDLVDGTIQNPINMTEYNQSVIGTSIVWTNTYYSGVTLGQTYSCNNWTDASTSRNAIYGSVNSINNSWTYGESQKPLCSRSLPLYCFEQ